MWLWTFKCQDWDQLSYVVVSQFCCHSVKFLSFKLCSRIVASFSFFALPIKGWVIVCAIIDGFVGKLIKLDIVIWLCLAYLILFYYAKVWSTLYSISTCVGNIKIDFFENYLLRQVFIIQILVKFCFVIWPPVFILFSTINCMVAQDCSMLPWQWELLTIANFLLLMKTSAWKNFTEPPFLPTYCKLLTWNLCLLVIIYQ